MKTTMMFILLAMLCLGVSCDRMDRDSGEAQREEAVDEMGHEADEMGDNLEDAGEEVVD